MAQLYATGPVAIYPVIAGQPVFLGHGRRAPVLEVRRAFAPVETDIAGREPHDESYGGSGGLVTVDLRRYNESVLATLQDVASAGTGITNDGTEDPGEIGTLMVEEGAAYPLIVAFPNSVKPTYNRAANGVMPAGYRWAAAHLLNDRMENGWQPRTIRLVWRCLRVFDPGFSFGPLFGRFTLYTRLTTLAGLPPVN